MSVIIQKSTKGGFGLTVTEALWKERPVVALNIGGITLQIKDGETGLLKYCKTELIHPYPHPGSPDLKS